MVERFIEKHAALLKKEEAAEKEEFSLLHEKCSLKQLCNAGLALQKLQFESMKNGFYGRLLLKFSSRSKESPAFPSHKLSPGDIVGLSYASKHQETLAEGVVSKVRIKFLCRFEHQEASILKI
jgi:hypothetical protein